MEVFVYTRRDCPACKVFSEYITKHYPYIEMHTFVLEEIDGVAEYLEEWLARTGMVHNRVPAVAFDKTAKTYTSAQAIEELKRRLGSGECDARGSEACTTVGCPV